MSGRQLTMLLAVLFNPFGLGGYIWAGWSARDFWTAAVMGAGWGLALQIFFAMLDPRGPGAWWVGPLEIAYGGVVAAITFWIARHRRNKPPRP